MYWQSVNSILERFRLLLAFGLSILLGVLSLIPIWSSSEGGQAAEFQSWEFATFLLAWMNLLVTMFIAVLGFYFTRSSAEQSDKLAEERASQSERLAKERASQSERLAVAQYIMSMWDTSKCQEAVSYLKPLIYGGVQQLDHVFENVTRIDATNKDLRERKKRLNAWAAAVVRAFDQWEDWLKVPQLCRTLYSRIEDYLLYAEPLNCIWHLNAGDDGVHDFRTVPLLQLVQRKYKLPNGLANYIDKAELHPQLNWPHPGLDTEGDLWVEFCQKHIIIDPHASPRRTQGLKLLWTRTPEVPVNIPQAPTAAHS